jgi:hypothetical protein
MKSENINFICWNKTDRHGITEMLLKEALNTTNLTHTIMWMFFSDSFFICLEYFNTSRERDANS